MNTSEAACQRRARAFCRLEEAAQGRPVYLASPYTHPKKVERNRRAVAAAQAAAELMKRGLVVYAPIPHGHAIAARSDLPTTWAWWQQQCHGMLSACAALAVLELPGWQESVGVRAELDWASKRGMPIVRLEAGDWLPGAVGGRVAP